MRIWSLLLFSLALPAFAKEIHQFTLPNGLTLIVQPDHRAPVVTTQVWYRVGSSYEPLGLTGISHALEHMMFQGTQRIGSGTFSELIAQQGGEQNAMTTSDYTVYYQEVDANSLRLCFELEADRMQNLLIAPESFEREKKVIMEERRLRTEDNPQGLIFERLNAAAHISNAYHHPVIGWSNDIEQLTAANLKHWYQRWYKPNNAVLVVVGDVIPNQVLQTAKRYFGAIPKRKQPQIKVQKDIPNAGKREVTIEAHANLPMLMLAYNVPSLKTVENNKDIISLLAIESILSGGYNSRIERQIVRDKALAAGAKASYSPLKRLSSLFLLYAVPTPSTNIETLKAALLEQITHLKTSAVSSQEIKNVITRVKADFIYQQDSFSEQATLLGNLAMLDLPLNTYDDILKELDNLTPKDIQQAAQRYLIDNNLTIATLYPR